MKISELLATMSLHDSTISQIKRSESALEMLIDLSCQDVGAESGPTPGSLIFNGVTEVGFDEELELSDDSEILSAKVTSESKNSSLERIELLIQDGSSVVIMWISAEKVSWNPAN